MNNPALYEAANDVAHTIVSHFAEEFSDEIGQMSGRCLDVGSGPGNTVVDLILPKLNEKASLVCSDICEEMVNFARDKYKDNQRLSHIKLDIETPNLPKDLVEQFDHVISFWCLHWCQDMRQTFENIFNLLRPGGTTLLLFVAKSSQLNCYKILEAMPRYQPYMKDADRYIPVFQHSLEPRKTLKALIEDVGFEVHHCSVREKSWIFENRDDLSNLVMSVNPFIDRIPAGLMKDYEKDLVDEFAKQGIIFNKSNENEDEYSVLSTWDLFFVHLRKPLANNN